MKSEDVKQMATNAIETLATALETGKSDDLKRYLAAMGRFHRYSPHNVMLIALQKPTASHVAGFHTWKKLGRFVRKGEKAIFILAPMVKTKENAEGEDQDGNRVLLGFRGCGVFDYSQTEGCELPSIGCVVGDPTQYQERLIKFVAAQGIALSNDQAIHPARGISEGGKITLLPGMTPAENFATLVHELAHELLHRANRATTTRRERETEAEAVTFVVCTRLDSKREPRRGTTFSSTTATQNCFLIVLRECEAQRRKSSKASDTE